MQQPSKEIGKLPPQAIDIEKVVLGAMIVNGGAAVDECLAILRVPDAFYKMEHKLIYIAISQLHGTGRPVDLLTVSDELRKMEKHEEVGGDYYLTDLVQRVASSAHIEYHSRILLQRMLRRRIIAFNAQVSALAYDDSTDVFDLLDKWQNEFDKATDLTMKGRKTMSFKDALSHLKSEVEILSNRTDEAVVVGIPTGFKRTDRHTGGYRDQDLVIIAARPGMGKTAKVLKTVIENVKIGNPVGFISLEMSIHQLAARAVAIDTNFHLKQLLKTGFEHSNYWQTYDSHAERMGAYPLLIDDSGEDDITEIVITAKMWKRVHGIKLLVVDYLQLMHDKSVKGNREGEIASISRRLKKLAKELQIPVIALSQLSRAVETRGGSKRPMLSDLRESGAIEQDADIVEFIYRPGYYNIDIDQDDYDLQDHKRCIALGADSEIIYAKYRGGSTGTALLQWIGDKTKFVDVEDDREMVEYIDRPLPTPTPDQAFDNDNTVFDAE